MRRWPHRLAVVAASVVVVLLVAALGFRWWGQARLTRATAALEDQVGQLDPSRFLLPAIPDDENAAVWLSAGAQAVVIPDGEDSAWKRGHSISLDQWTPELTREVEELLDINRPAIQLLERSLPLEESNFGIQYEQGAEAEIPPVLELWRAGKLIRLDARLALLKEDRGRLDRDIALLDQLGRSLTQESLLITALIAVSVDRLLIETACEGLQWSDADARLLSHLQVRLEGRDPLELLSRALVSEASMVATGSLDELQSGGVAFPSDLLARILEQVSLASLLEGYARMWGMLQQPFSQIQEFYLSDRGRPDWNVFDILLPNLLDAISKVKGIEASRLLTIESLKLRLHCLERGAYPARVEIDVLEPYAAGPIQVEAAPAGELLLTAPRALDLWAEFYEDAEQVASPPLSLMLPACGR